jgi:hypothetical protein
MDLKVLESLAFDKESLAFGGIASINFLNQKVSIMFDTNEEPVEADLANVVFLPIIGNINGQPVCNHDVLLIDEEIYEIESVDGRIFTYQLDNKLQRVAGMHNVASIEDLLTVAPDVAIVANINQLEPEDQLDFDIKVVKEEPNEGFYTYHFACNNKAVGEIDLVEVSFWNGKPLKGKEYKRTTISYEDFIEYLDADLLVEVDLMEVVEYAQQLEEVPEEATENCPDCKLPVDNCECDEW